MRAPRPPAGLGAAGRGFWRKVHQELPANYALDATQIIQLEEVCRAKDRLDRLDAILRGQVETWGSVQAGDARVELKVERALRLANVTADVMKKGIVALRLPDPVTGRRPQRRQARGSYQAGAPKRSSVVRELRSWRDRFDPH